MRFRYSRSTDVRLAVPDVLNAVANVDRKRTLKGIEPFSQSSDVQVRRTVVFILAALGQDGVPLLTRMLENEKTSEITGLVCACLADMGNDAKGAAPALLKLADNEEHWQTASSALGRIAPERTFGPLLTIAKKRDETLRQAVPYPAAICGDPAKLTAALLKDWKKADVAQAGTIAHAFVKIKELLPQKQGDALVLAASPILSRHLAKVKTGLTARANNKERLEAAETLVLLSRWHAAQTTCLAAGGVRSPKRFRRSLLLGANEKRSHRGD